MTNLQESMKSIPMDFPRRAILSGLAGAVSKYSVRRTEDGKYTNFVSDDEYLQAYQNAEDLAQELKSYALRKERENPNWTRDFNLERIKSGLNEKFRTGEWDVVPSEQDWIMQRIAELLR